MRENGSRARLGVGRPIDSAGRNVVKMSMRFTCGSTSWEALDRTECGNPAPGRWYRRKLR